MQYPLSEKTASTASFNLHALIHRITGVGRDLGRWSNSTFFCSQKGQLKQAAQGHVQSGFECFLEWTLHNQSGQLVPVFNHPHGERYFHINIFIQHCIWAHCLLSFHSTLLRGVCVLYHSHQVFMHTGKIPLSLLFFRMNRPNSHSFSWHAPSSKLITSVAPSLALLCYIHLLNGEFITGHNILQTCLIRAE